jgi:hypothetical protein
MAAQDSRSSSAVVRRPLIAYVYSWFGEPATARFDAGLMNADGSPRKAFSIVRTNAQEHR